MMGWADIRAVISLRPHGRASFTLDVTALWTTQTMARCPVADPRS